MGKQRDLVWEISRGFDIYSFLIEYVEVRPYEMKAGEYMTLCPWCEEHGFTLEFLPNVNQYKGLFSCFKCKTSMPLCDLVMHYADLRFDQALRLMQEDIDERPVDINHLESKLGVSTWDSYTISDIVDLPSFPLPPGFISLYNQEIPYTRYRRWDVETINTYRLGWIPPGHSWYDPTLDKTFDYTHYLIIPNTDINGRVLYWVARDMTHAKYLRYNNPPRSWQGLGSGAMLFNFHRAKYNDRGVIVEGVTDAMRIGTDAMATYGMGLKGIHLDWLIYGGFKEIVLMLDNDGSVSGEVVEKQCRLLADMFKVSVAQLPAKGDPDDFDTDTLRRVIDEARPYRSTRITTIPPPPDQKK